MASKQKPDVKVLKGQEAEDKVLEYIRRMNRPYGAVDVAANLKGAVPKTATQKILVALAEKGELVQKNYGKTTFFVVNQTKIDTLSPEKISALEEDFKKLDDENKALALQIKTATTELSKIRNLPSDSELEEQLASIEDTVVKRTSLLQPLRSGAPPVSSEEVAQIDTDWLKWREEWIRRKKIFNTLWALATDSLPPQDAAILSEDLGIEEDTPEHTALEKSHLCADTKKNLLKRKR
ncbi:TBPIP-domain-containing protein [Lentinula raphanica]|uniref:TBPIP-domain-containing protein n=1 Tax=Lentinula raphanica TaxID=153919 RepID=A0AA38PIW5_9AGAR|nr:TBPIP-domain-containing protein [Lentinula raphanica]